MENSLQVNKMKEILKNQIISCARNCARIYEKRGWFSVGDIQSWAPSAKWKEVIEALEGVYHHINTTNAHVPIGFYYINDNWKQECDMLARKPKSKKPKTDPQTTLF